MPIPNMKEIASGEVFKNFYRDNFIYVDKTEKVLAMIKKGRAFLSRPRRFGKSTILDTIGTLFERGVEPYFKDTWIYDKWNSPTYPVLRLNFLEFDVADYEVFAEQFIYAITDFAEQLQLSTYKVRNTPSDALLALLSALRNTDKEIVILIDEYDRQLCANINNEPLYEKFGQAIQNLCAVMKGKAQIRFLGITGVTRLKDASIFSVGSDIVDISFDSSVASIAGFTKDEIRNYYHDYLVLAASLEKQVAIEKVTDADTEAVLEKMAAEYDGYSFDKSNKVRVFNTWSVNRFFSNVISEKEVFYGDYWYDNGGMPSILANYLKNRSLDIERLAAGNIKVNYDDFRNPVSLLGMDENILMSQTGYLTLRSEINPLSGEIALGIPDNEVRRSLFRLLTLNTFGVPPVINKEARVILEHGKSEAIVGELNTILNSISYDHHPLTSETVVRNCLHCFMMGCGLNAMAEAHSANGRSDLRIDFNARRLVFEFKYGTSDTDCSVQLAAAASQMRNNNYGDVLPRKEETVCIALVFDGNERKFTHWQEV